MAVTARVRSPGAALPLDTTTRMLAPFLDRLTDEELDALPYGVIQLDHEGFVISYNRAETDNVGFTDRPIGRHYFFDAHPCTNVSEFYGRFLEGVTEQRLDDTFNFTYSCGELPRRVMVRQYYSMRTKSVWLFVAKPDGSPYDRAMENTPRSIRPTPSSGVDLCQPRLA